VGDNDSTIITELQHISFDYLQQFYTKTSIRSRLLYKYIYCVCKMSVVQGISKRLQMQTPRLNVPSLLLQPAAGAGPSGTPHSGRVRSASPVHVPSLRETMAPEFGLFALFYAGLSDGRHTHRWNALTQLHPLLSPLSSLSFVTDLLPLTLTPMLPRFSLEISYSSSDSSSGDSYSSSSKVLKTNEAST